MRSANSTLHDAARWLQDWAAIGLIRALLALPYRWRVPAAGWLLAHLVAPLAGYRRRVRENLALIFPQMPKREVERMARAVPNNAGRTFIEECSGEAFRRRAVAAPLHGAGVEIFRQALRERRAVIVVSGHFGNYDTLRARLVPEGHLMGGLYRPFPSPRLDRRYRAALNSIGGPVFPRGRRGLAEMVQHLRQGRVVGMLIDQHMAHGAPLQFFGHTAWTATSAAEMALKYDALLMPGYSVRQPDGLNFVLEIEPPVPPSTPEIMTQALNDSLERQVRAHMDQWLWMHRRWKTKRPD